MSQVPGRRLRSKKEEKKSLPSGDEGQPGGAPKVSRVRHLRLTRSDDLAKANEVLKRQR